ncbi:C40 family peptidase [Dactylosporangium roseum]|nr:C40 family peptidase [Dactylosporangium roseum]
MLARLCAGAVAVSIVILPAPAAVATHEPATPTVSLPAPPDQQRVAAERATRAFNRRPPSKPQALQPAARPPAVQKPAVVKPATRTPKNPRGSRPPKPRTNILAVAAPASGQAAVVLQYALAQVGKPYVWAAAGPRAFDCSGLVMASYARVGIGLPHQSEQIAARGHRVPNGQWRPGDIIHTPGHVAIYLGNGRVVEAANPSAGVRTAPVRGGVAYRFL